jgi:hypothetical protein
MDAIVKEPDDVEGPEDSDEASPLDDEIKPLGIEWLPRRLG